MKKLLAPALLAALCACANDAAGPGAPAGRGPTRTIVMVWDGLRPDSVNAVDTPNLEALRRTGVDFADNHATFPTFTMMNASAFATGSFPKTSGFYGNTFWTPPQGAEQKIPVGRSAAGAAQDYVDPIFTEDYQVLTTLDAYYAGQLLLVKSLFATAQAAGLVTATVGKSGAAYLQDLGRGGYFLDENTVAPRSLAAELQAAGFPLPANVTKGYAGAEAVTLAPSNGNPTGRAGYLTFDTPAYDPQGVLTVSSRDAVDTVQGVPEDAANRYMLSVYTRYLLPVKKPMLSVIWFRTPDNVEHGYGPGSANARAGLRSQDARLGELTAALKAQGLADSTNLIVVSDHGHSTVSGPLSLYPLRQIVASDTPPNGPLVNGAASGTTTARIGPVAAGGGGQSFSGDVRSADLLTFRGWPAYDGFGCTTSSMYGLSAAGVPTVPVRLDASGALCGTPNTRYQAISAALPRPVARFLVPEPGSLPAHAIVVAANGGADYFYVPDHDPQTVRGVVRMLQQREEYGAVFVDSRYGALPGTFALAQVRLENATRQDRGQPDIVASFAWDVGTTVNGLPGIEYESAAGQRGMHGSFGISDVHNTLIAGGPSFKASTVLRTPTGNVDLAPTVAHLLGLALPQADGRIVDEALVAPASRATPTVTASTLEPATPATGLRFELPTDPTGATADTALAGGRYSIRLAVKDLAVDGRTYRYFDFARATRE